MLRLSFGCWNYDRTRALMDGRPEQVDAAAPATSEMISRFLFVDPTR